MGFFPGVAPRNSDDSWYSDGVMRLYFPFEIKEGREDDKIEISTAILRLYKKPNPGMCSVFQGGVHSFRASSVIRALLDWLST